MTETICHAFFMLGKALPLPVVPAGLLGWSAGGRVRNEIRLPAVVPAGLSGWSVGGRVRNETRLPGVVLTGLLGCRRAVG